MRILFFIGSLRAGGKERRLVELLSYLNKQKRYKILVLTAYEGIAYNKFNELDVGHICLNKNLKKREFKIFPKLYKICTRFRPEVIHTWGRMPTFYMGIISKILKVPLINNQITDSPSVLKRSFFERIIDVINFKLSTINLANSYAGLKAYKLYNKPKSKVIYNGVDFNRFINLTDINIVKKEYNIITPYCIIMVATYSPYKDYKRFIKLANYVTNLRNDISFISVGDNEMFPDIFFQLREFSNDNNRILLYGYTPHVESLINACDIGVLFSVNGEGISNSILEYMALGKPVIVDECGGTTEFVKEGYNGYFTSNKSIEDISNIIIELLNNRQKRIELGENARKTVKTIFSLERMGKDYENLYSIVIKRKSIF